MILPLTNNQSIGMEIPGNELCEGISGVTSGDLASILHRQFVGPFRVRTVSRLETPS